MKIGRKEGLLAVLLLLLVVVLGRRFLQEDAAGSGTRAGSQTQADPGAARALIAALPALDGAGGPAEEVTYQPGRNLFEYVRCAEEIRREREQFARAEAARLATQKRNEVLAETRRQEAQQVQRIQAENPPAPVAPQPPFKYVAYLGPVDGDGRPLVAVFAKRGGKEGDVLVARAGDVVEDGFVVKLIDWDRVELGYTDPKFSTQKKVLEREDL